MTRPVLTGLFTPIRSEPGLMIHGEGLYHPRSPESSPLWKALSHHYDQFEQDYTEKFERKHSFFRPVISEVVQEYLNCGDLKQGFARIRCPDCAHEYLLAFSCKARWFCPSCHAKKVVEFGDRLRQSILYPVPHRQYVFTIPILLRVYFKYDRRLLSKLCRSAYESLLIFLRTILKLSNGTPGVVMAIQTIVARSGNRMAFEGCRASSSAFRSLRRTTVGTPQ